MISALLREGLHALISRACRRISPCNKEGRGRHGRSAEDGPVAERRAGDKSSVSRVQSPPEYLASEDWSGITPAAQLPAAQTIACNVLEVRKDSSIAGTSWLGSPANRLGALDLQQKEGRHAAISAQALDLSNLGLLILHIRALEIKGEKPNV